MQPLIIRILSTTLLGLGVLLVSGCQQQANQGPPQRPPVNVTVAKPLKMPIVEWDEYTGRLDAIDSVEVRARVSGYLASTHFEEGRDVKQGDLLAIIDPRPFQAELNSALARLKESQARLIEAKSLVQQAEAEKADASAQLTLADRRLVRARQLLQNNAVAKEEVDIRESEQLQATATVAAANAKIESAKAGIATAEASIETARADVEAAELSLQYTQVRAPVSGRISRRYVTEGNLISGGSSISTLITTIVSLNPIHVYFDANEQAFLNYVRLSQNGNRASSREAKNPVFVALVDEQGYPHQGHMDFVDNQVDPNTGTMRGRAILPNDDGILTPGLFATVRLPGSGRYEATLIPDSAIASDQADRFVYVVKEDNSISRQLLQLGPLSHGLRVIRSGLEGDEWIVISGLQGIYPNATANPTKGSFEAQSNTALPSDYQPVPKEQWLSRSPEVVPAGVEANNGPSAKPEVAPTEPTGAE